MPFSFADALARHEHITFSYRLLSGVRQRAVVDLRGIDDAILPLEAGCYKRNSVAPDEWEAGKTPLIAGQDGVTSPKIIKRVAPEYPSSAFGVEGGVPLRVITSHDGKIPADGIEVEREDPPGFGFADAAVAAVKQWRFEPARFEGKPVDAEFQVFVQFTRE